MMASSSSPAAAAIAEGNVEPPALAFEEEQEQQQAEQKKKMFRSLHTGSIFATLDAAQSLHGIPLQDYAQYHAYCRKRLHRLTHHKDVRSILTHNAKYESSSSGASGGGTTKLRRHAYCPRNLSPENVQHEYVLWNLLFQAERAWAQACAAQKEDASNSSRGLNQKKNKSNSSNCSSRTHNHVRQRLNKAVKWATQFVDLVKKTACCHTSAGPIHEQEAQAYLHWMQGNAHLECKRYADAYRHYQSSRRILLQLAANDVGGAAKNSSDDVNQLAIRDLWTRWAESVLKPLVRYCLHEARDTLDPAEVLALEQVSSSSHTLTGSSPKMNRSDDSGIRIEFRNQTIALDAYPQLAVLYLKMEEHLFSSKDDDKDKKKQKQQLAETAFLQLLSDLDDATSLTLSEAAKYARLSSSSTAPAGPTVQAKRKELATLQSFFTHHKLQLQRQRQEDVIVSSLTDNVAEIVHVYDALLQNAQAMADLHSSKTSAAGGDDNDNNQQKDNDPTDEDDPYWLEAQAHLVRIRAWRCFYLARLYESLPASSSGTTTTTAQAVAALLQQASLLQQRAMEEVAACEMDNLYLDSLQALQSHIQNMKCRVEATRFLELQAMSRSSSNSGGKTTTDRPLWLRLDDLDAGTGILADQPPLLIPIPYKPVFYDLAYDHIFDHDQGLKTLQNYIQEHGGGGRGEAKDANSGGGGIFGWFSSK